MREGEIFAMATARRQQQQDWWCNILLLLMMVIGGGCQVGEVERRVGEEEVQDKGVGEADVQGVARPKGEVVRVLVAAADGGGGGGGEVEEEFGLGNIEVDCRRRDTGPLVEGC